MNFRYLGTQRGRAPRGRVFRAPCWRQTGTGRPRFPGAGSAWPKPPAPAPPALPAPVSASKGPPPRRAAPKAAHRGFPPPSAQQGRPTSLRPEGPAPGAPQGQDQQVQLIYAPWTKFPCLKGQGLPTPSRFALPARTAASRSGPARDRPAVIIEARKARPKKKILRVTLFRSACSSVHGNPPSSSTAMRRRRARMWICFQNGLHVGLRKVTSGNCSAKHERRGQEFGSGRRSIPTVRRLADVGRCRLRNSPRPYDGPRRPTRRYSRKPRRSCRKNCRRRSAPPRRPAKKLRGHHTPGGAPAANPARRSRTQACCYRQKTKKKKRPGSGRFFYSADFGGQG